MNFNSQVCTTREQSERLIALGLKKQTADMHHYQYVEGGRWNVEPRPSIAGYTNRLIPAWSLDRLICMINDSDASEDSKIEFYTELNRYDEAIALIQSLIHIGQFNKEYLIDNE